MQNGDNAKQFDNTENLGQRRCGGGRSTRSKMVVGLTQKTLVHVLEHRN